jgi:hypothetical protein
MIQINQKLLLERAFEALTLRWPLRQKSQMVILKWIRKLCAYLFRSLKPGRNELLFSKASERLEKELDIRQLIKHMRYTRNIFKFLTTRRERLFVRMQAA